MTLLRDKIVTARKDYKDMAITYIDLSGYGLLEFTKEEMEQVEAARKNNFMIKKGDRYLTQLYTYCTEILTFRAIPELHKICCKYDLYPDDI